MSSPTTTFRSRWRDENDYGFTKWTGGECPVEAGATVELICRDHSRSERVIEYPTRWDHLGTPCDIVAYKITLPANT